MFRCLSSLVYVAFALSLSRCLVFFFNLFFNFFRSSHARHAPIQVNECDVTWNVSVLLLLLFLFSFFIASTLYAFPLDDLHSLDLPSKRFSITFQAVRIWVYVRWHTKVLRCILYFILINLFDYHMNRSKRAQNTNTRRGRKRERREKKWARYVWQHEIFHLSPCTLPSTYHLLFQRFYVCYFYVCLFAVLRLLIIESVSLYRKIDEM